MHVTVFINSRYIYIYVSLAVSLSLLCFKPVGNLRQPPCYGWEKNAGHQFKQRKVPGNQRLCVRRRGAEKGCFYFGLPLNQSNKTTPSKNTSPNGQPHLRRNSVLIRDSRKLCGDKKVQQARLNCSNAAFKRFSHWCLQWRATFSGIFDVRQVAFWQTCQ